MMRVKNERKNERKILNIDSAQFSVNLHSSFLCSSRKEEKRTKSRKKRWKNAAAAAANRLPRNGPLFVISRSRSRCVAPLFPVQSQNLGFGAFVDLFDKTASFSSSVALSLLSLLFPFTFRFLFSLLAICKWPYSPRKLLLERAVCACLVSRILLLPIQSQCSVALLLLFLWTSLIKAPTHTLAFGGTRAATAASLTLRF